MTIETPSTADIEALALARRSGWPEDLRVLIARFPREQWEGHANLGEMARFWLSRHAMFRELATMIAGDRNAIPRGRAVAGRIPAPARAAAAIPAVAARRAPPDRGSALFPDLPRRRDAAGARLRRAGRRPPRHPRRHGSRPPTPPTRCCARLLAMPKRCAAAATTTRPPAARLLKGLIRHLDDEEDLIVPLILDRGEEALGVAHHG